MSRRHNSLNSTSMSFQAIRCAMLTERDVVVYFSYSGSTRDVVESCPIRAATDPIWRGPSRAPHSSTTSAQEAPGDLGKRVIRMVRALSADRVLCMGLGGSMVLAQEAAHLFSTALPNFYAVEDSHHQAIRAANQLYSSRLCLSTQSENDFLRIL